MVIGTLRRTARPWCWAMGAKRNYSEAKISIPIQSVALEVKKKYNMLCDFFKPQRHQGTKNNRKNNGIEGLGIVTL
jgi:hypothetical protein